ncbi:metallophosphoesterase family protein [uncultured Sphingomonas sp.]|mgnify:CR=1 FL=1|uniref:metallophosphoesterase family protein n=1 Tax=uncultured Sphingomonas sp. TaxID=158754 RepID=UPI0026076726|nr:metallophosphoesterase family protein [uncultured Sphingomonas sp.]
MPAGVRVYAIGDIHGRLDCLNELLDAIERDSTDFAGEARLIFLGDLIDRGPESRGVVDRAIALAASSRRCDFIKGNHEELLLHAAKGDRSALSVFHRAGGRETMLSYGADPDEYDACDFAQLAELIARLVPAEHLAFLDSFSRGVALGDYRFVHAGMRPGVPFEEQKDSDLRWIRREFLSHDGSFDGMVVHGHTISEAPEFRHNRIGIDTGAFASGRLTALVLEGQEQRTLESRVAIAAH